MISLLRELWLYGVESWANACPGWFSLASRVVLAMSRELELHRTDKLVESSMYCMYCMASLYK